MSYTLLPDGGVLLPAVPLTPRERAGAGDWLATGVKATKGGQSVYEVGTDLMENVPKPRARLKTKTQYRMKLGFMLPLTIMDWGIGLAATAAKGTEDEVSMFRLAGVVSSLVTCGGTVLGVIALPGTLGLSTALVAVSAVACAKSVTDVVTGWHSGQSWFDETPTRKLVALSIDVAGLLGTGLGLGWTVVRRSIGYGANLGRAVRLSSRAVFNSTRVSTVGRVGLGLEATGVGVSGVRWLLDATATPQPATPDAVTDELRQCGLLWPDCQTPWSGLDPDPSVFGRSSLGR